MANRSIFKRFETVQQCKRVIPGDTPIQSHLSGSIFMLSDALAITFHRQSYSLQGCVPAELRSASPKARSRPNITQEAKMSFRAMPKKIPGFGAGPKEY